MKVIGLTGGIACGKSSVGVILRNLGVRVIDADEIAHRIYLPGTSSYTEIVTQFGPGILDNSGLIDRKKLGKIVFNNQAERSKLERITHPVIIQKINDLISIAKSENLPLVVVEVPLLFETGLEGQFDYIWVVSASPDIRLKRLMERNQLTAEEAAARFLTELPLSEKEEKADVVIYNNSGFSDLEEKVKRLLEMMNPEAIS